MPGPISPGFIVGSHGAHVLQGHPKQVPTKACISSLLYIQTTSVTSVLLGHAYSHNTIETGNLKTDIILFRRADLHVCTDITELKRSALLMDVILLVQ